jgi:hypothetical protein
MYDEEVKVNYQGMTLRDYFAAKAMQGLITSRHTDYENGWYDEEQLAESAYKMADAMLSARSTEKAREA